MATYVQNPDKFAVVAVTQDEALIWRHGVGVEDVPQHIRPPVEVDHRHKRTGQFQHGHDTAHRFPDYFEDIANQLRGFEGILIMGHGTGKASYSELLLKFLERKHPDIYHRVVDSISVNIAALSEGELRNSARSWFERNFRKLASWHERTADKRFK